MEAATWIGRQSWQQHDRRWLQTVDVVAAGVSKDGGEFWSSFNLLEEELDDMTVESILANLFTAKLTSRRGPKKISYIYYYYISYSICPTSRRKVAFRHFSAFDLQFLFSVKSGVGW